MAATIKDLGKVTAYAYAKAAGYTGTEEQFQAIFNEFTENAPGLIDRMDTAVARAEAAVTNINATVQDAVDDAVEEATASTVATANQAVSDAQAAQTAAEGAVTQANAAVTQANDAVTAAQAAQAAAEDAAASFVLDRTLTDSGAAAPADLVGDLNESITQITYDVPSPNFFTGYTQSGSINNTTGENSDSNAYVRTDYIPIDSTNSTLHVLRDTEPWGMRVFFYDANKVFISPNTQVFTGTVTVYRNDTVAIPSTAAYVRTYRSASITGDVSFSYTYQESIVSPDSQLRIADKLVSEESLTDDLREKINSLYGKKVAFFGDSIVGNFNDSTGICSQIATKTGATVINCAFGGTRMAYRYGDNIQYTYWNALSGVSLMGAVARNTWTDQDTAVANMTGGLAYFTDRLAEIKAIDWSTVDYILWEYGTNDFTTEVMLSDTTDTTNMYAFDNAYRTAIETLLTAYPNIQIIPITPIWRFWNDNGTYLYDSNTHTTNDYEGTSRLLTAFVEKVVTIAKEYQLPCIDDYYALGANKFTRSAFFNATDGTHPNANGRKRIAEHISSQLDTVI